METEKAMLRLMLENFKPTATEREVSMLMMAIEALIDAKIHEAEQNKTAMEI